MAAYFSLILVLVTLVSGLIWLIDVVFFAPKRRESLLAAQANSANFSGYRFCDDFTLVYLRTISNSIRFDDADTLGW